jgi:hypothetical protein
MNHAVNLKMIVLRRFMDEVDPFGAGWRAWCFGEEVPNEFALVCEAYSILYRQQQTTEMQR